MDKSLNNSDKIISKDGSHTLYSRKFGEHYHSVFGAVQESKHIFIDALLKPATEKNIKINIFEVGFGTGLNALLTLKFSINNNININYLAVEAYPLETEILNSLNHPDVTEVDKNMFLLLHSKKNKEIIVNGNFKLTVYQNKLQEILLPEDFFNIIYFDAFSPEAQPEMWQLSCFKKLYKATKTGGMLSTYSSKGDVKRALKSAGFKIEKLPGPPGKREFVRAIK
jgi:tRNA U34 5-methylaminomethyl-2-thiouridine-forming methyltransferase MnmC